MENPSQAVIFVFMEAEDFLKSRLEERRLNDSFRALRIIEGMVDLCSNDYLGIVKNHLIRDTPGLKSGSTGSRLLAGNYPLIEERVFELAGVVSRKKQLLPYLTHCLKKGGARTNQEA